MRDRTNNNSSYSRSMKLFGKSAAKNGGAAKISAVGGFPEYPHPHPGLFRGTMVVIEIDIAPGVSISNWPRPGGCDVG